MRLAAAMVNNSIGFLIVASLLLPMILRPPYCADGYLFWNPVVQKAIQLRNRLFLSSSSSGTSIIRTPQAKSEPYPNSNNNELISKERILLKVKYYNRWSSWCSTSTVTTTSTSTISTNTFCATLFNVRGACRRRKKLMMASDLLLFDNQQLVPPTKRLE